ncbi:MAG: DUF3859 domain-containing protein [Nostocaceae cyanobacterium]|nr:DUF3859 domain-containing protein [Nostocaceae cyanobacterium]
MTQRLTQEQLTQIIAEVEKLKAREEAELDRKQVEEILQELNLPPELLDDALMQVQRKQALQAQEKRKKWIIGGLAALLVVVIGFSLFSIEQYNSVIARVQAQEDRVTLVEDNGNNLKVIERQSNPEVFYRVTLKNSPLDKKLQLSCDWINPSGEVVKQNRYQTREITTSVWNTYCRYTIPTVAPTGNWQVRMFLNNRQLSQADFEVK